MQTENINLAKSHSLREAIDILKSEAPEILDTVIELEEDNSRQSLYQIFRNIIEEHIKSKGL